MTDMSEVHNNAVQRTLMGPVGDIMKAGGKDSDLCVYLEAITTGVLLLMSEHYKMTPAHASAYVEEVLNGALKTYSEKINKRNSTK